MKIEFKENYLILLLFILCSAVSVVVVKNLINIKHYKTVKEINKVLIEVQDIKNNMLSEMRNMIAKDTKELLYFNSTAHLIAKFLKIHKAYDKKGPLELKRYGKSHDGGYVVPEKALYSADVLLGYGIDTDISFEEDFSFNYQKPSYGFDCGINSIKSATSLFTFVNECIGSDKSIYSWQGSSTKVSSFKQQLDRLKLKDKKLFIKMDIEGSEYEVFDEILEYQHNITGIALELHFELSNTSAIKALKLLRNLDKNFVLLHAHGNNHCQERFVTTNSLGQIPGVIELTYINKSLVTNYHVAEDQSHPTSLDMPNDSSREDAYFEILP